jgi:bifunctional non-homologous end joining protein LigD
VSRKGNTFQSFTKLCNAFASLKCENAVLDGEIVCLENDGRPCFSKLMTRRVEPYFIAYDLLWLNGKDLRGLPLIKRKAMLKKLLPEGGWLRYSEHIGTRGIDFFRVVCEHDLEDIVAKLKTAPYSPERSTWLKIKNPNYSQAVDRQERFSPKKIAA